MLLGIDGGGSSTKWALFSADGAVLKQGGRVVEKAPDGSTLALNAESLSEKLKADEANVKSYCTPNGL